jgi:hypothetical protein
MEYPPTLELTYIEECTPYVSKNTTISPLPGADIEECTPYVSKNPTIYLHPGADIDRRVYSICK